METAPELPEQHSPIPADHPELVVQNGRLRGAHRRLSLPLTLIGRAAGCDIRLNVDGVSPLHCVVVAGPDGLLLRDLLSTTGTLVNGERVTSQPLHDRDLITVGPFQFRVRLPASANGQPAPADADQREVEDALRIQAAAVAAQQAALTELESQLQQRAAALEQQEAQLSSHLEEKQQRLLDLRDEVRQALAVLKRERAAHEIQVKELLNGLETARQEAAAAQRQAQAERQRLVNLRIRLKRRWHRHWAAERSAMRRREAGVGHEQRRLESEAERLRLLRAKLDEAWARFHGEAELGRRQLQAAWGAFHQEQRQWQEKQTRENAELDNRSASLARREAVWQEAEQQLAAQRQNWDRSRLSLEKEAEGLDSRIRNQRRKLLDHEQEVARLEAVIRALVVRVERNRRATGDEAAQPDSAAIPFALPVVLEESAVPDAELQARLDALTEVEAEAQRRLKSLAKLSDELADQRLQLAEQFQRFVEAQQHWQQEQQNAAAALEAAALRLQHQERGLQAREQALTPTEDRLHRKASESAHLRQYLAGWQSRLTARQVSWEAERDRLLADIQARETLAEERLQLVGRLHARWTHRRRQEAERLRAEQASCEQLRREWAELREEWLRRRAALQQEERTVAERTLALEQYRQQLLAQSPDPTAIEKGLKRLRRQWATQFAGTIKAIREEQSALQAEAGRLETRYRQFHKQVGLVTAQQLDVSRQRLTFERDQALAEDEYTKLRQELLSLYAQRERYERQVVGLQDEVERIAYLLLDEADSDPLPAQQAA